MTIPLDIAHDAAVRLRDLLAPACERIEIAGSVRRRKPEVKDIELVALPLIESLSGGDLWGNPVAVDRLSNGLAGLSEMFPPRLVETHRADGSVAYGQKIGERYQARELEGMPVDLFIVRPPSEWGVIFAIRTGPGDWNEKIVTDCQRYFRRVQNGQVLHLGKAVPCAEEEDFFEAVGQPWVDPWERSVERVHLSQPTRNAA